MTGSSTAIELERALITTTTPVVTQSGVGIPRPSPLTPPKHHNVRSRLANEPDREQLHLFNKFGHIRWAVEDYQQNRHRPGDGSNAVSIHEAAAKLRPLMSPPTRTRTTFEVRRKGNRGRPGHYLWGSPNPQAIAKKKAVHERLYKTLSAKMENDPELKDWADRQVGVEGHEGPKAHG